MFWHTLSRRLRSSRSLLRAFALSLLLMLTTTGGVARAGDDEYCVDQFVAVGQVCYGTAHSLTSNRATNEGSGPGCAGAYGYGQYFCATSTGCHTYDGTRVLTPGVRHKSTTGGRYMYGEETYGTSPVGPNCAVSTPYAVSGPLEDEAAFVAGIPVLDRGPVTAPDAVAALLPSADPAKARTFKTPRGQAWVLVDPSTRSVCLVADDAGTGYGLSCQRYGVARDQGSITSFEDPSAKSASGTTLIALLPEGVDHVTLDQADGSSRTVMASGGVVAATLTAGDRTARVEASPNAADGVKGTQMAVSAPARKGKAVRRHR